MIFQNILTTPIISQINIVVTSHGVLLGIFGGGVRAAGFF